MINTQTLRITSFKGINKKAAETDVQEHQCQILQNLELSRKPGKLVKRKGYTLATLKEAQFSTTGLSGNIVTFFEYITDQDSPNEKLYLCQTDANKIYRWNPTTRQWEELSLDNVYDKTRWFLRKNVAVAGCGSEANTYPIWYGYVDERYPDTSNPIAAGFKLQKASLKTPTEMSLPWFAESSDWDSIPYLPPDTYYYRMVAVYDGFQKSLPQPDVSASWTNYRGAVKVKIELSSPNLRITSYKVYRANSSQKSDGTYYLLREVSHDDETLARGTWTGTYDDATGVITATQDPSPSWVNDQWIDFMAKIDNNYYVITDSDANSITIQSGLGLGTVQVEIYSRWHYTDGKYIYTIFDHYPDLTNNSEMWTELGYSSSETSIEKNYKYAIVINNRQFIGPYYDTEERKNRIAYSFIDPNGNYILDAFPSDHIISLDDYGITEIMGLGKLMDRLIIFGKEDILKLNVGGTTLTWSLDETYQNVGLCAPDSLTYIEGYYFYLSVDGARIFDGNQSKLISAPIEDVANFPFNVTDLTEAIGIYDKERKQWLLHFPTDNKTYIYDLITGQWREDNYANEIAWAQVLDNTLLTTDGINIYQHNSGNQDYDTPIIPRWKSKVYNMGVPDVEKILIEYYISYISDTTINFNVYIDRSSSANVSHSLEAKSTEESIKSLFPIGTRGYEFEFEITAPDENTNLEINEIVVKYLIRERL